MAMSMRERIARVIMARNLPDDLRDTWENEYQEQWLADADAVLSELEKPTEGMMLAALEAEKKYIMTDDDSLSVEAFQEASWAAAILAAKEGK